MSSLHTCYQNDERQSGEKGGLAHCWWGCKLVMEKSTKTLQKLKTEPPCSKGDEIKMKESSAAHIHGSTIP
jgi:hypothetical protein